jgi:ribosome maturation factor RimP
MAEPKKRITDDLIGKGVKIVTKDRKSWNGTFEGNDGDFVCIRCAGKHYFPLMNIESLEEFEPA